MHKEERFYKTYSPNTNDKKEFVIPNEKTLYLSEMGGDAAFISSAVICIEFDGEIIFSTHGSSQQETTLELVGDGFKKIKISASNTHTENETLGAYWKGRIL